MMRPVGPSFWTSGRRASSWSETWRKEGRKGGEKKFRRNLRGCGGGVEGCRCEVSVALAARSRTSSEGVGKWMPRAMIIGSAKASVFPEPVNAA